MRWHGGARRKYTKEDIERVMEMKKTMSVKEIANQIGTHESFVRKIFENNSDTSAGESWKPKVIANAVFDFSSDNLMVRN